MKNILITGGAGFIGSNLAITLKNRGYNVTVIDNLTKQIHGSKPEQTSSLFKSILKNKINFIQGDVTNKAIVKDAIKDCNTIFHFAAETGTGQSMYLTQKYSKTNILGTAVLLDILASENHSIKKIILASSRAIYGEGKYFCKDDGIVFPDSRNENNLHRKEYECICPICSQNVLSLPTSEDSKINPISIYGVTKQNQEQMISIISKVLNIPVVILRFQNVYGPGQSLSNPYTGILSIFSTLIRNRKNIEIYEDGKESRDFIYIDDVVNASILALEKNSANNKVFNVGTGNNVSVLYVAKKLKKLYDSEVEINISYHYRVGDIRHNFADTTKIKKYLNFSPRIDFDKGIISFCNWVKNQKNIKDNYTKSVLELKKKGLFNK